MGAALIEVHAAFLIDESLQELELRIREWNFRSECEHSLLVEIALAIDD